MKTQPSVPSGIVLSASTVQATGMRESKLIKTFFSLYNTKANRRYIKNIPFPVLCMLHKVLGMNRPPMDDIFKWQAKMKKSSRWHSRSSVKRTRLRLQLWAQRLSDWVCQSPKGCGLSLVSLGLSTAASPVRSALMHHLHKQMYTKHLKSWDNLNCVLEINTAFSCWARTKLLRNNFNAVTSIFI